MSKIFINRVNESGEVETVDNFDLDRYDRDYLISMVGEYNMSDHSATHYLSEKQA